MYTLCVKLKAIGASVLSEVCLRVKKYVAIVLGNLSMATWQLPYGKNLPRLYGRLIKLDISRMMHQGDIGD